MTKKKKLLLALALVAALVIQSFSLVQAASRPEAPKITAVTQTGSNKLTVSWKYQSHDYGYQLWRSTSKNGKYTRVKTLQNGINCYTNKGLTNGTTYYYKVRAFVKSSDGSRIYSSFSTIMGNRPAAGTEGKSRLGTYMQKYNAPYSGYYVTVAECSKNSVTFQVEYVGRNGSPIYSTYPITAKLNGNTCNFTWKDSWNNRGTGTLTFKSKAVQLTMKQTYTAPHNRATLETKNKIIKWHDGRTSMSIY